MSIAKTGLLASVAVGALIAGSAGASAGGFAIREQSASAQGSSFAGNAAGSDLSTMFWNPAGVTIKQGYNSESHAAMILPQATIDITSFTHANSAVFGAYSRATGGGLSGKSGDIADIAFLGSSYMNYQFKNFDPNLYLGLSMASPFGLATQPNNNNYSGAIVGRESKLRTYNFSPTLGYKVAPNLSVAVGAQLQYGIGAFTFASPTSLQDSRFEGSGWTGGFTAGLLWDAAPGTTIGLGWRSQMRQDLHGAFINYNTPVSPMLSVDAKATINLPDIVTLSLRQSITPQMRLLGTVEWSRWSSLESIPVRADGTAPLIVPNTTTGGGLQTVTPGFTIGALTTKWTDGWMFALGGEYDVSRTLTWRAGGAYEMSPINSPTKRLIGIPDADRIWASTGFTYKWSEMLSFDGAYTHVFIDGAKIDRESLTGFRAQGSMDASVDIVSASAKIKW